MNDPQQLPLAMAHTTTTPHNRNITSNLPWADAGEDFDQDSCNEKTAKIVSSYTPLNR